jgi:hypothetical protein
MGTPDGRPGWATMLVQKGYKVYVVDRPGHGRSPFHPDVHGPFPAQANSLEAMSGRFTPPNPTTPNKPLPFQHFHNQWPGTGEVGSDVQKPVSGFNSAGWRHHSASCSLDRSLKSLKTVVVYLVRSLGLMPEFVSHDWHVQPSCQRPNRGPPRRCEFSPGELTARVNPTVLETLQTYGAA